MKRPTLAEYRKVILALTVNEIGMALDVSCPQCGYPEMSGRLRWPEGTPLGVAICRKCGHGMTS